MLKLHELIFIMILQILLLLACTHAQNKIADKVIAWPDYNYPANSYSGIITLDDTKSIHYVYLESLRDPATDPLIVWMGGGPGCTSLFGMSSDIGPFVFDGQDKLIDNPYSLSTFANLLFIDTPAGVGYSTFTLQDFTWTDEVNAQDNLQVLKKFLTAYNLLEKEFYIGGASYAGMYVTFFATAILDEGILKLKGIMMGNAVIVEDPAFIQSTDDKLMAGKSFYDPLTQSRLLNQCQKNPNSVSCKVARQQSAIAREKLNVYDVYGDCLTDTSGIPGQPPCVDPGEYARYFNRADVRTALHATKPDWQPCSMQVIQNYNYHPPGNQEMLAELAKKIKILHYTGNNDEMVGEVYAKESIKLIPGIKVTKKWRAFGDPVSKQLAGWVTDYNVLRYVVLRNAGHLAASYQRENALIMFKDFLNMNI